jgi:putative serine protease PepD
MFEQGKTFRAVLAFALWLCLSFLTCEGLAKQTRRQTPPQQPIQRPPQPTPRPSQPLPRPPLSAAARDFARQAVNAVGLITVRNTTDATAPRPRGSAVFISKDGLVATNYHVVAYESPQTKTEKIYDELFINLSNENQSSVNPQKRFRLKLLLVNKYQDLALLRVSAGSEGQQLSPSTSFPALELGDSRNLKLLEDIFIIGFPEKGGASVTINTGVVEGKDTLNNWIKTDARLIHGNSGGAAVNAAGQLIGIPTKVVYDTRRVDKDGDGFPDEETPIGAVGFLRPTHLLVEMMKQLNLSVQATTQTPLPQRSQTPITVSGLVKTSLGGKGVAGARIGLVIVGSTVSADNLLAWGGTNADGKFELNNPVPTGRYTLRVKAIGYETFTKDVEISPTSSQISVELRPSR